MSGGHPLPPSPLPLSAIRSPLFDQQWGLAGHQILTQTGWTVYICTQAHAFDYERFLEEKNDDDDDVDGDGDGDGGGGDDDET